MRSMFLATALTTTCLTAGPVFADVTPEDVWASYHDMMASIGMEPKAEVSREGDTLVVRNMIYGMNIEMGEASITDTTTAPEIRFQERQGGTVAVWFPQPLTSIMVAPSEPGTENGDTVETRSTVTYIGEAIVSGTPDDILYTVDNAAMTMVTEPVIVDHVTIQPGVSAKFAGISGTSTMVHNRESLSSEMDMTAATLTYEVDQIDTEEDGTVEMGFVGNTLSIKGAILLPQTDSDNMLATLLGQSTMDVTMDMQDSASFVTVTGKEPSSNMDIRAATGLSTLDMTLKGGAIGYDISAGDLDITVAGPQIPGGQVALSMAEYSGALFFPLAASEDDQPFSAKIGLKDLVLPEIAWMIADPTGQLSRDPANLRLAFEGTLKSDVDLFDMNALMALEEEGAEEMPFEVKTLALPDIYLALAGATVAGNGAGHFLDQEPAIPGGMPPFTGKLNLTLNGVTELIDKLSASGIMPQETAMSAQMMLGLFARPGTEPGELVSEIEMTEDGAIIANGQPLPF
ncbi:DUF2125 domain-containing protein [Celeribacter persicus]|uniref:Uncharacterized protein DUF2125 n=1 Tax=Celeribacter persicus TaxID=1651082 RepID=A0A2T5HF42_9RHOB|nr:DUF2125 domain-containing protein [Celeribacter persicus]PTQ70177.1 uncharacterized protein DUF2125 [Celeribacter persicus]